jgi:hypothetical protein
LIGEQGANITNINFTDRKPDFYNVDIELHVRDIKHLSNIMTSIRADSDIADIVRTRDRLIYDKVNITSLSNIELPDHKDGFIGKL